MPKILKVATVVRPAPSGKIRKARIPSATRITPTAVKKSHTGGLLIAFAQRTVLDARRGKPLSPLQASMYAFLERRGLTARFLRRLQEVPKETREAISKPFSTLKTTALDAQVIANFTTIAATTSKGIKRAAKAKSGYQLKTALRPMSLSAQTVGLIAASAAQRQPGGGGTPPAGPPPGEYSFMLTYRGITTHKTSDRWGGVEPYFINSFYLVPDDGSGLMALREPHVVRQQPWGLDDMDNNQWMPSGGYQDSSGNPNMPWCLFSGNFPPLPKDSLYYAIMKVMEEDGGQGEEIAKAMGDALLSIGGKVLTDGLASGNPAMILAGAILAVLGLFAELLAFLFASEDEFIGDILIAFDHHQICSGIQTVVIPERVKGEGNNWTLYFGAHSVKW